ncbi:response regulator [Suttonella ornithocola]|uniref:Stalked cell differentiation-controlling protein n=1 Tax=Suttonella ornithocola TaxID=279832 RepID=A0A380MT30_9GAMM|nr:response regulator [Suttonella ornithocola]SUO95344.1 Stalked cell differentiation-controlling protein [Suttonella ornithocola]
MTKILIVDDSPTEANIVRSLLEEVGYEVLWADNADKGIQMATEQQPNVILMDVVMPGMSGFQATRKLTRNPQTQNIPILMLTTKDQKTDEIWGIRNGAKKYMVKPPEKEKLLQEIKELLG